MKRNNILLVIAVISVLMSLANLGIVYNKVDLVDNTASISERPFDHLMISAKTGKGVDSLRQHLKTCIGFENIGDGVIIAYEEIV